MALTNVIVVHDDGRIFKHIRTDDEWQHQACNTCPFYEACDKGRMFQTGLSCRPTKIALGIEGSHRWQEVKT